MSLPVAESLRRAGPPVVLRAVGCGMLLLSSSQVGGALSTCAQLSCVRVLRFSGQELGGPGSRPCSIADQAGRQCADPIVTGYCDTAGYADIAGGGHAAGAHGLH